MAQDSRQSSVDAGVYAAAIEAMGKDIGRSFSEAMRLSLEAKGREGTLRKEGLQTLMEWVKNTPADQRAMMLRDPAFRRNIMQMIDPDLGMKGRKGKSNTAPLSEQTITSLGMPSVEESAKQSKAVADSDKAKAEAGLAQQQLRISTGLEAPTPMNLLFAGKVTDPLANAMFSLIPQEQLKNIALFEKKQGPLYSQAQQQEWYKWGIDQGFSPGLAMHTALAIANGQWDQVPTTYQDPVSGKQMQVRGKAEQQLALDAMKQKNDAANVQNTIASSIATTAIQLAEKAGIPLDQARANVIAVRNGKPAPFAMPNLVDMAALDITQKKQEVEKNTQTILNDKSGVAMIRESLSTLLAAYKQESGTVWDGAKAADLKNQINVVQGELAKRLGERYGIQMPAPESTFWQSTKGAMSAVWNSVLKPGLAFGADMVKILDENFNVQAEKGLVTSPGQVQLPSPQLKKGAHTPEQEQMMKTLYSSMGAALADDKVPAEQKKAISDYMMNVLEPAFHDPAKFIDIFKKPEVEQEF